MTIKAGVPTSAEDFYKDSSNWPAEKGLRVEDVLDYHGEPVKLSAVTDAVRGRSDHVYSCFVTVGDVPVK